MANVSKTAFNLVDYARQNNLKLAGSLKLKDGNSAKFLANKERIDCFVLDANKQIVQAKGAKGSQPHLFEFVSNILDNFKGNIVS